MTTSSFFLVFLESQLSSIMLRGNNRSLYLAGPSAVGKSTILDKIIKMYPNVDVSLVTYASLYKCYVNHDKASKELLRRTSSDLFEHSIACPVLYENIHVDCKHLIFMYKNMKSLKTIDDLHYKSMSFDFFSKYHAYYQKLVERFADAPIEIMEKLRSTFVIIDITKHFYDRYYTRMQKDYNGIDMTHDVYLYVQIIAYFALGNFLVNLFPDYNNIYVIIDKNCDNLRLFNGRDFDILDQIPTKVNFVKGPLNDSFVRNMSTKLVDFLKFE